MAALNFEREGTIREGLRYHDRWTDVALYGILRPEGV